MATKIVRVLLRYEDKHIPGKSIFIDRLKKKTTIYYGNHPVEPFLSTKYEKN